MNQEITALPLQNPAPNLESNFNTAANKGVIGLVVAMFDAAERGNMTADEAMTQSRDATAGSGLDVGPFLSSLSIISGGSNKNPIDFMNARLEALNQLDPSLRGNALSTQTKLLGDLMEAKKIPPFTFITAVLAALRPLPMEDYTATLEQLVMSVDSGYRKQTYAADATMVFMESIRNFVVKTPGHDEVYILNDNTYDMIYNWTARREDHLSSAQHPAPRKK